MSGAMSPDDAIAAAIRRNPHLVSPERALTPFDVLARAEEEQSEDVAAIRFEAIGAWLGWLFEGGLRIEEATKRLYVFTRAYRPELLLNMSGEEIASLFGQGRAAESDRSRRVIEPTLRKSGARCTSLPYQKTEGMRRKCAVAQKGNHNRAGRKAA